LPDRLEPVLALSGCLFELLLLAVVDFDWSLPIADCDPDDGLVELDAGLELRLDPDPLLDAISDWLCWPCRWLRQVSKSLWNFCSQSRQ
jgi:hypothetical protein